MKKILIVAAILGVTACNSAPREDDKKSLPFHPAVYSLAGLAKDYNQLIDSPRALARIDSSLIKQVVATPTIFLGEDTYSETRFYRYKSLNIDICKAQVVAIVTDFNTVSVSLQLLLFDKAGNLLSKMPLAF